jgi:hypothetical protein
MKIRNIQLKSIEARRYSELQNRPQRVRIDHNSTVNQINEVKKGEAKVDFQYTSSFGPVGLIKIEGSLIYIDEEITKFVGNWQNDHKMPDEIASKIHTAVMHACVPEAVGIAKDLGLPPPIPLPQVKIGKNPKKGQVGQAGPEVT